jgi:hypothetical protein
VKPVPGTELHAPLVLDADDLEDVFEHTVLPELGEDVALVIVEAHTYKNPKGYAVDK